MRVITVTEANLQSSSQLIDKPNTKADSDKLSFNSVLNQQVNSSNDEQDSQSNTLAITDNKYKPKQPSNSSLDKHQQEKNTLTSAAIGKPLIHRQVTTTSDLDNIEPIETDINTQITLLKNPNPSSTDQTKNPSTEVELTNNSDQSTNSLGNNITPNNLLANINMANQISHANKNTKVDENKSESIASVSVIQQSAELSQDSTTKDLSPSKTSSEAAVFIAENPVNLSLTDAQPKHNLFEHQIKTDIANTASTSYQINNRLHESGWNEAFSQRIIFMNHNNINSANITINPEHLGPIQVQLQINAHQQTTIQFFAEHPEVRQTIQNSLPQLNSLFEQSGIQLGQTSVSSQQSHSENNKQSFSSNSNNNNSEKSDNNIVEVKTITRHGLINIYV